MFSIPRPKPSLGDYSVIKGEEVLNKGEQYLDDRVGSGQKRTICIWLFAITLFLWTGSIAATISLSKPTCSPSIRPTRGLHYRYPRLDSASIPRPRLSCGNSSAEAEARGCTYDPMVACWTHKDCPRDGTEEFLNHNGGAPWRYWYDHEGKHEIPDYDTLSRLDGRNYWTTSKEHLVHCKYMLLRGHEALGRGDRLDSLTAKVEHANHCASYLMDFVGASQAEIEGIHTRGNVGFLSC